MDTRQEDTHKEKEKKRRIRKDPTRMKRDK